MKSWNTPIPKGKLGQFDSILKACGGRYLRNPQEAPDQYGHWRVSYGYEDIHAANEHNRRWQAVTTDIRETFRHPWWKRLFSRAYSQDREPTQEVLRIDRSKKNE